MDTDKPDADCTRTPGKSGGGPPQSKTWRKFGMARGTRSLLACASPLELWSAAMANPNVAADVSPLIIPAREEFEPTHVGCYGSPHGQPVAWPGARGWAMTEIKWGLSPHFLPRRSKSPRRNAVETGAKTGAFRTGTLFSDIHFGMDDWGERARLACWLPSARSSGVAPEPLVEPFSLGNGFRRDAENGNRDGRAPRFQSVGDDVRRLILQYMRSAIAIQNLK